MRPNWGHGTWLRPERGSRARAKRLLVFLVSAAADLAVRGDFATAAGLKPVDEAAAPKFWWRDMPDPFADPNRTLNKERKEELEKEKEANKKRTKWDNGVAVYLRE